LGAEIEIFHFITHFAALGLSRRRRPHYSPPVILLVWGIFNRHEVSGSWDYVLLRRRVC